MDLMHGVRRKRVVLSESTKLDGAGHMTILLRIILPLSKATLAFVALYEEIGTWGGWFWSSLILRNNKLHPLQLVIRGILL